MSFLFPGPFDPHFQCPTHSTISPLRHPAHHPVVAAGPAAAVSSVVSPTASAATTSNRPPFPPLLRHSSSMPVPASHRTIPTIRTTHPSDHPRPHRPHFTWPWIQRRSAHPPRRQPFTSHRIITTNHLPIRQHFRIRRATITKHPKRTNSNHTIRAPVHPTKRSPVFHPIIRC